MNRHWRQAGELSDMVRLGSGAHVCCVVDSAEQFEAWTARCLDEGAARGEKLFRFGPAAALARVPTAAGSVTVADPHTAFLSAGPVDPGTMYAMFRRETATALREGYRGLRLVADMDWLLPVRPSRGELAAFELLLDEVVNDLGATVVCAYRTENFDPETVAEMVAVHPLTLGAVRVDPGFRMWNVARGTWEITGEVDAFNANSFHRALASAAGAGAGPLRLRAAGLRFVAMAGAKAILDVATAHPDLRVLIDDPCTSLQRCWGFLDCDQRVPGVVLRSVDAEAECGE